MSITFRKFGTHLFAIKFFVLFVVAITLQIIGIYIYRMNSDEGVFLVTNRLFEAGYEPYTEIFSVYPPVFLILTNLAWRLGQSILTTKIAFIGINSALYFMIALIGAEFFDKKIAFISCLLLVITPQYTENAVRIMADMPSVLFSTITIYLVLIFNKRKQNYFLLFVAGILFSLSVLTKLLVPFVAILVVMILIFPHISLFQSQNFQDALFQISRLLILPILMFASGFSLTIILFLFFFDPVLLYDALFLFRLAVRNAFGWQFGPNFFLLLEFFLANLPLTIGVLLAFWHLYKRHTTALIFLISWFALSVMWLMLQTPLHPQHLTALLPPAVLIAGYGFLQSVHSLNKKFQPNNSSLTGLLTLLLISLLIGYGIFAHYQLIAKRWENLINRQPRRMFDHIQGRQEALIRVGQTTSFSDCIVTDDPFLLLELNRLPPPELADVSLARSAAGYLTLRTVINAIEQYNCQAVVITNDRLKLISGLREWLQQNFLLVSEGDIKTYLVKKGTNQHPNIQINRTFSNGVKLVGFEFDDTLNRGQDGFISFYWQIESEPQTNSKMFIHARNSNKQTLFYLDRYLFGNEVPINILPLHTTIKNTIWFSIPKNLETGQYTFYVGFYNPETGERYALNQDTSGENAAVIGPITVK